MKNQQCGTCVSRRDCKGGIKCSLGVDIYLENEVCGTYEKGNPMDDYRFEYGYISVDELYEKELKGN